MTERWALRLDKRGSAALSGLRRVPGLEVLEETDALWLRGTDADEHLWRRLLGLPTADLFRLLPDGQLVPHLRRVPCGRLPEGSWLTLSRWLGVKLEPAALPGQLRQPVALTLTPSTVERPAHVLLTSLSAWIDFAESAPAVRLQPLRFAVADEVVVRGDPLPPLPGMRYCEVEGVAVRAGWTWLPAVEPAVLASVFGLAKGDLALWHADGTWDHIRAGDFVAATRSAVRLTAREVGHES